ncbi:MAG: hypothetical protein ACLUEQ_10770 [Cloacibacillus evryensis]
MLLYSLIVIPAEEDFLAEKFMPNTPTTKESFRRCSCGSEGASPASANEKPFDAKRAEEIYSIRVNIVVTLVIVARLFFL